MVHNLIKWSIDKRVIQVVLPFNIIFHLRRCPVKKRPSLLHFCYSTTEHFIVLKQYCMNIWGSTSELIQKIEDMTVKQSMNRIYLNFLGN
jgi:hypothetical protein